MKSHCKNFSGIVVGTPQGTNDLLISRLRCKEWDCDFCAPINAAIWRAHIIDRVNDLGGEWLFLTVTAHRNAHKAGKTVVNLKNAWKRLYDRLRYKFKGQEIEYVWLFEKHTGETAKGRKIQTYHIHAILRAKIEGGNVWHEKNQYWYHPGMQNWLKDNAAAVGAGFMAHVAKIEGANGGLVAAYITKYMTKSAQTLQGFPKHGRRISVSRGFGSPKPPKGEIEWHYRQMVLRGVLSVYDTVKDVSTGRYVKHADFDEFPYYPKPPQDE